MSSPMMRMSAPSELGSSKREPAGNTTPTDPRSRRIRASREGRPCNELGLSAQRRSAACPHLRAPDAPRPGWAHHNIAFRRRQMDAKGTTSIMPDNGYVQVEFRSWQECRARSTLAGCSRRAAPFRLTAFTRRTWRRRQSRCSPRGARSIAARGCAASAPGSPAADGTSPAASVYGDEASHSRLRPVGRPRTSEGWPWELRQEGLPGFPERIGPDGTGGDLSQPCIHRPKRARGRNDNATGPRVRSSHPGWSPYGGCRRRVSRRDLRERHHAR